MWFIKLSGCVFLILALSAEGVRRANLLKKRITQLEKIIASMDEIPSYIRLGTEAQKIMKTFLPEGCLTENGKIIFGQKVALLEEDKRAICDFWENFGMGDKTAQIGRCVIYKGMLENRKKDALAACSEKYKLYFSGGFTAGLALSLLFL